MRPNSNQTLTIRAIGDYIKQYDLFVSLFRRRLLRASELSIHENQLGLAAEALESFPNESHPRCALTYIALCNRLCQYV